MNEDLKWFNTDVPEGTLPADPFIAVPVNKQTSIEITFETGGDVIRYKPELQENGSYGHAHFKVAPVINK